MSQVGPTTGVMIQVGLMTGVTSVSGRNGLSFGLCLLISGAVRNRLQVVLLCNTVMDSGESQCLLDICLLIRLLSIQFVFIIP